MYYELARNSTLPLEFLEEKIREISRGRWGEKSRFDFENSDKKNPIELTPPFSPTKKSYPLATFSAIYQNPKQKTVIRKLVFVSPVRRRLLTPLRGQKSLSVGSKVSHHLLAYKKRIYSDLIGNNYITCLEQLQVVTAPNR